MMYKYVVKRFKRSCFSKGFTLIELLVVVLIIGILAAIAVPKYQIAVIKSKLVPIEINVNSLFKSMEMYEMTNGTPHSWSVDMSALDVGMQFDYYNSGEHSYYNQYGQWQLVMSTYASTVHFFGRGSIDKINISFDRLTAQYDPARKIQLSSVPQELTRRKIVCQWWAERHGTNTIISTARTRCREVGVG